MLANTRETARNYCEMKENKKQVQRTDPEFAFDSTNQPDQQSSTELCDDTMEIYKNINIGSTAHKITQSNKRGKLKAAMQ